MSDGSISGAEADALAAYSSSCSLEDHRLIFSYYDFRDLLDAHTVEPSLVLGWAVNPTVDLPAGNRFVLLWALATCFWRSENAEAFAETVVLLKDLLRELSERDAPFARAYLATFEAQLQSVDGNSSRQDVIEAARFAIRESENLSQSFGVPEKENGPLPGALNYFAGLVADQLEQRVPGEQSDASVRESDREDAEEAHRAMRRAIHIRPDYPKYFSTDARVLAALGRYRDAHQAITLAIRREDGTAKDYDLRLVSYTAIKERISTRQLLDEIIAESNASRNASQTALASVKVEVEEMNAQHRRLEERTSNTIAAVIAIVSLVLSGAVISAQKIPAKDAVVVLGGVAVMSGLILTMLHLFSATLRSEIEAGSEPDGSEPKSRGSNRPAWNRALHVAGLGALLLAAIIAVTAVARTVL